MNTTNNFPTNTQFNGLLFNTNCGAFVLNGNPINLGSNITDYSTNTQTINLSMALVGASRTFNVYAAGDNVQVTGGIGDGGSHYGINKTGPGTLTLSGTNTYTGGTTVSAGTLKVTSASALPAGTSLTVGAGATVMFDSSASDSSVVTTAGSNDTGVATAMPSSTSPASSSPVLSAPITAVSGSAGDSLVQSSTILVTPVTLPFPAPSPGPRTNNLSKSVLAGALDTPAASRLVGPSTAKRIAGDLAWTGQGANSSDNWDQRHKNDVATVALDAVFAQYGR